MSWQIARDPAAAAGDSIAAATAAAAKQGGLPHSVVMAAPAADYERERASCKQLDEDWPTRCKQLRALPSYLVAVEWPAEMAPVAMRKAASEADCIVLIVDSADSHSVEFLEEQLLEVPDNTPVVVVQVHRRGATTPEPGVLQQQQAAVTDLCDSMDVEGGFTFTEGSTTGAALRSGLWKVVANLACDPFASNPQTQARVERVKQATWRAGASSALKLLLLGSAMTAAGVGAWVYQEQLKNAAKCGAAWLRNKVAPSMESHRDSSAPPHNTIAAGNQEIPQSIPIQPT
jgi:hypothetical protein